LLVDLPGCRSVADPGHRVRDAGPRRILAHLRDPVLAPFVAVAAIPAMILATALAAVAFAAGRVAAVIFLAVTIAVGGWLTGQWIVGASGRAPRIPATFPSTVAGGLIGGLHPAGDVGLLAVAEASFGIGSLRSLFNA
jgi:tellurite resistance protein